MKKQTQTQNTPKLQLKPRTIRPLSDEALEAVNGGGPIGWGVAAAQK